MKKLFSSVSITNTLYCCALILVPFVFLGFHTNTVHAASWYNNSWAYRTMITIDHSKVASSTGSLLSYFPVLISTTTTALKYTGFSNGHVASSTGKDILFTSSTGTTKLDHEIELYASSTGNLVAWVQVPSMATSTDTVLYMYYGNASAADQSTTTGVWDDGGSNYYKGVWHLATNGATINTNDSTPNANNGSNVGAAATASGIFNGVGAVNGFSASKYITTTNAMVSSSTAVTLSSWIYVTAQNTGAIVTALSPAPLGNPNTGSAINLNQAAGGGYAANASFTLWMYIAGVPKVAGPLPGTISLNQWYYVVGRYDGVNITLNLNGGTATSSTAQTGAYSQPAGPGFFGAYPTSADYLSGSLSEIRFSSTVRSVDWIKTEYNNQSSPSTFYTSANEETIYTSPTVTTQSVTSVTATTAVLNGTIANTGNQNVTARGFVWGTTTAYGATTTESGSFSAGAFSAPVSGLTAFSTYHFAAYAINPNGTSYGADSVFTVYNVPNYGSISNSFFLNDIAISFSGGNSMYSLSTSTSFGMFGIGGETGNGTSTSSSFGLLGGYMRSVYHIPAPIYEQVHYHWRNDDGSEASSTSATGGVQDTTLSSISVGTIKRLRVQIANHGGTVRGYLPQRFGLQYGMLSSDCGAISSWTNVGSSTVSNVDWVIGNSSNLTSGADTTDVDLAHGGTIDQNHSLLTPNGGVVDQNGTTTLPVSLSSDKFIELEYSLVPTSVSTAGVIYCFRVENASSTLNYKYTVYPQASVAGSGGSLTFVVDSNSEAFPSFSPGTAVSTSSILYMNTTNSTGLNVSVTRSNSTSTLMLGGSSVIGIPDTTSWTPGNNCSTSGNSAASTSQPLTLKFRIKQSGTDSGNYCSAWWGANDTSTALFAGLPTTSQKIINRSTASSPTTTATVLYSINAPTSQNVGTYTGTVTYTAVAN